MKALLAAVALLPLAACATVPADGGALPGREPTETCKADGAQRFVGQRATGEAGAAVMAASGATRLRWLPPRSVVTMEYALGRVNVAYDDTMTITAVRCG